MDVTGVGNVAKNKRSSEVNIQSEDWNLVYQTLSANRSSTMFDMSVSDLFQLRVAAIYSRQDTPFLYLSGIVTTEPCPFSSLTQSPLQFPPKSSLISLLTDVELGGYRQ